MKYYMLMKPGLSLKTITKMFKNDNDMLQWRAAVM